MSNYKNNSTAPGVQDPNGQSRPDYESTLRNGRNRTLVTNEGRDVAGWDSYRRWLNRVQSNERRRMPMDPALYTWKGYRNWSEKIRRDWKQDE
jgi:hypothetical protein